MGNFNSCSEGCCTLLGSHPSKKKDPFVVVDLAILTEKDLLDSDRNVISQSTYSTTYQEGTSYGDSGISRDLYSEEGNGISQDSVEYLRRGSETFLPDQIEYTLSSNHDALNSRKKSDDMHKLSYKEKINFKKQEARRIQKSKMALEAEAILQRARNTQKRLSNENQKIYETKEPSNLPRRSLLFKQRSARGWWNSFKAKGDAKFHRSLLRKSHKKEAKFDIVEGKIPQTVFLFHSDEPAPTQEKDATKEKHVRWQ
ncbi:predicted protein [Chaetoceros tenuissimus]|uniref:Uncharacterized protein n=1 Tax=Chaetoceros tenuissimus TaxID=426638 RepID=A0AAD3DCP5_9STRA|nr:predicted protein [Chaetoceros tenuissimus]